MPRVNIHEIDNTKPGTRGYQNFTVVVPGFHAPYLDESAEDAVIKESNGIILQKPVSKRNSNGDTVEVMEAYTDAEIFGDENILELQTQADFEQFIGFVKPKRITDGVSVPYIAKNILATDEVTLAPTQLEYYDNNTYLDYLANGKSFSDLKLVVVQDNQLNTFTFKSEGKEVGTFKYALKDSGLELYGKDKDGNWDEKTPIAHSSTDGTYTGTFVTLNGEQEIIEAWVTYNDGEEDQTIYQKFECDVDLELPAHYGNQIAYELLGLGYKVLFVNMGEYYPGKQIPVYETDDNGELVQAEDEDGNLLVDNFGNKIYKQATEENGSPKFQNIGRRAVFESFKALSTENFWANLRDKTTYDFRFVLTGFIDDGNPYFDFIKNTNFEISKLVSWEAPGEDAFAHVRARGDALALIDLDESAIRANIASDVSGLGNTTKRVVKAIQKELGRQNFGSHGKYSAVFTPSVTYTNNTKSDIFENSQFPASFHYLACFAKSVFTNNFKEWFAVAGFTRGNSIYNISSTAFKLGDIAVQALEPRFEVKGSGVKVAANVIVNNRGSYYIWGNRTAHDLGEELVASHFLNIRQLCISIKKFIYTQCRKFTFDPNSDILWLNFVNSIKPLLDDMKNNQGLRDYDIVKETTNLKGVLAAKVRIIPIEAVEDFEITVSLEDSLNGTQATVGE